MPHPILKHGRRNRDGRPGRTMKPHHARKRLVQRRVSRHQRAQPQSRRRKVLGQAVLHVHQVRIDDARWVDRQHRRELGHLLTRPKHGKPIHLIADKMNLVPPTKPHNRHKRLAGVTPSQRITRIHNHHRPNPYPLPHLSPHRSLHLLNHHVRQETRLGRGIGIHDLHPHLVPEIKLEPPIHRPRHQDTLTRRRKRKRENTLHGRRPRRDPHMLHVQRRMGTERGIQMPRHRGAETGAAGGAVAVPEDVGRERDRGGEGGDGGLHEGVACAAKGDEARGIGGGRVGLDGGEAPRPMEGRGGFGGAGREHRAFGGCGAGHLCLFA
ncbi:hypothetical protein CCUS01_01057 [Colletotrichum cuscutae]|uniref:Uncharacterized protein n=1 Tax=Colletotrichum cuscutae TaxID=1209917 RepID=A0AAI9XZU4_9PEZI|nr:hypothetical protein CCUS01_01057 [Colletotrichum cuscutae]